MPSCKAVAIKDLSILIAFVSYQKSTYSAKTQVYKHALASSLHCCEDYNIILCNKCIYSIYSKPLFSYNWIKHYFLV